MQEQKVAMDGLERQMAHDHSQMQSQLSGNFSIPFDTDIGFLPEQDKHQEYIMLLTLQNQKLTT